MELRLGLVLLLGSVLTNVPQIVARKEQLSCNKTQYLHEDLDRCCNRCPPGQHMAKECTRSSETECQTCEAESYSTEWNYARFCRKCYSCSMSLVERLPCNTTQAAVCSCPDGHECTMTDGMNQCVICTPLASTEPTVAVPVEQPPDMKNIWIIVGVALFAVTSIVVVVCLKAQLLKRFGRIIKNKSCSESTPQPETGDMAMVGTVNGGPTSRLVENGPINTPSQYLRFPIQVSDETDKGECSLLAK